MGTSENKTKKLVLLITYAVAVVCLLMGLFLPLFNGKEILALELPNVFLNLINKPETDLGKAFSLSYPIYFFGKGKPFDFMALVVMLYALITFVSLLMLIPVCITFKKQTKAGAVIAYAMEIAAALTISLYLIIGLGALPEAKLSYNMLIAFGGALAMLAVQSIASKKLPGFVKLVLLLLSSCAFLFLFGFWITGSLGAKFLNFADKLKCHPLFMVYTDQTVSGFLLLDGFFTAGPKTLLLGMTAKEKAAVCLGLIVAVIVLVNFFIDIIGLATGAKRGELIFNVSRYLLELLAIAAAFITCAVCKYSPAFLLCLILIAAAAQFIISIVRLIMEYARSRKEVTEEQPIAVESYFQPVYNEPAAAPANEVYEDNAQPPVYNDYSNDYSYPSAAETAPEAEDNLLDTVSYSEPVGEELPYTLRDYKPAEEIKPEKPAPAEPNPEYIQLPQAQAPRATEIPTHNVYQTYTPNVPETPERIYKVNTVYQGPTDEFMKKLTNNEKIEFSMIFIEKSKGDIGKVPDYIIGGDNKKFFSAVFIYLGRMRSIVSDGLLNKMYKELNMLQ